MNAENVACQYNKKLADSSLGISNFGNFGISHNGKLYIKPSGINTDILKPEEVSVIEIQSGIQIKGLKPSTDTPTYLEIFRAYPELGSIIHTHSVYATAWAQSGKSIPCMGTTHADYWQNEIPITSTLSKNDIISNYEQNTGKQIISKLKELKRDPLHCPGMLVMNHGPFVWGKDAEDTYNNAILLEYIAKSAYITSQLNPNKNLISTDLMKKHFERKHGINSYYGQ